MKVEFKLEGLDGVLSTLKSLPPELVSKNGGPVRAAARKGLAVILKKARENFKKAVDLSGKTGITDSTGFTARQIVSRRKRTPSGENGEFFVITVRNTAHPGGKRYSKSKGGVIHANDIAFIMEFGSSRQDATPWLQPAFVEKAKEAIETTERELLKEVDKVVAKLAKGR